VFCFAGGGGTALNFLNLARRIGAGRNIVGFQPRGLEARQVPDWSVSRHARRHLADIRRIQPRGPYHLVGFSFGALLDPVTGVQNAVLGQVYSLFAVMVFLLSGGVRLMIMGVARSYDLIPLGGFPTTTTLAQLALHGLEQVPVIGFELVAPVLLAVLVTDATFGLLARTVPQMNVFVVALPLKVMLAFAVIAVSLPLVGQHLRGDLTDAVSQTLQAFSH